MDPLTAAVAARVGADKQGRAAAHGNHTTSADDNGADTGGAAVAHPKRGHRRQSSVELLPEEFVSHVVESSERGDRRTSVLSQSNVALKVCAQFFYNNNNNTHTHTHTLSLSLSTPI